MAALLIFTASRLAGDQGARIRMSEHDALEKRLRRHVIGRPHPFFAVTAPGLEAFCAAEIDRLMPAAHPRTTAGGVLFRARLDDAQRANLMVRTASRILMRIAGIGAIHFAQLEKALAAVAWELYLDRRQAIQVRVATHKSRLHHTDAVAQRVTAAVAERRRSVYFFEPREATGGAPQTLHVRADHDHFTVSLDTSGALLHKRGLKVEVGPAPIRETLAAAILEQVGYMGQEPLIDAMCGAGTFSLEAALTACRIPAGWHRAFAFETWPAFRPRRWAYLREQCGAQIRRPAPVPIWASDLNPDSCQRLQGTLERFALADSVTVRCLDFFDLEPRDVTLSPGVVVINPPYGRRLGSRTRSLALFQRICTHLETRYRGWRAALIAPPGADGPLPAGLIPRRLVHGGLRLTLLTGTLGG